MLMLSDATNVLSQNIKAGLTKSAASVDRLAEAFTLKERVLERAHLACVRDEKRYIKRNYIFCI